MKSISQAFEQTFLIICISRCEPQNGQSFYPREGVIYTVEFISPGLSLKMCKNFIQGGIYTSVFGHVLNFVDAKLIIVSI